MNVRDHRRWLQFTLRGLLVLMVLVSLAIAPLAWRAERQRRAVAVILATDGAVMYADEETAASMPLVPPSPPGPAWLRRCIGDDYFRTVVSATFGRGATDESLAVCRDLPSLKHITIHLCPEISDAGMEHLHSMPELESVHVFFSTGVTEHGKSALVAANPEVSVILMNQW